MRLAAAYSVPVQRDRCSSRRRCGDNGLVTEEVILSDGRPDSPNHSAWLLELGRTTRAAAQLATICFDLTRILGGVDESQLYDDPLGTLQARLARLDVQRFPELSEFLPALDSARRWRNDVLHAFLVRDGLFRRTASGGYDRSFFSVEELRAAREELEAASRLGNHVLYSNGGEIVEAWRQCIGS
jgi:hypothetical protein